MNRITPDELADLHICYPKGCCVKLIQMNDPYCQDLKPGMMGTVVHVDDITAGFTSHGIAVQRWAWYTERIMR